MDNVRYLNVKPDSLPGQKRVLMTPVTSPNFSGQNCNGFCTCLHVDKNQVTDFEGSIVSFCKSCDRYYNYIMHILLVAIGITLLYKVKKQTSNN